MLRSRWYLNVRSVPTGAKLTCTASHFLLTLHLYPDLTISSPSNFKPRSNPTWVNSCLKSGTVVALCMWTRGGGIKQDICEPPGRSRGGRAGSPEVADVPIIHIRDLRSRPLLPSPQDNILPKINTGKRPHFVLLTLVFDSDGWNLDCCFST